MGPRLPSGWGPASRQVGAPPPITMGPASRQIGAPPPVTMGPCGNLCPVPSHQSRVCIPLHLDSGLCRWFLKVFRFGGCFCPRVPHRSAVRASGWKMRCPSLG